MKLFSALTLKFEQPNWDRNPEFALLDTLLEEHPELVRLVEQDVTRGSKRGNFGRGDTPSVEQVLRAAIYKELKGLDYRELEYHQVDSRICVQFLRIDALRPYSFQMYQKYISQIRAESLDKLLVELNRLAIGMGLEDLKKLRQDSTVVESNIHYPTNNSLVWDCIKESHRLLEHLGEELGSFHFRDYRTSAKRVFFKINITKSGDKRADLFKKQLVTLAKSINQVANAVKKKSGCSLKSLGILLEMECFLPVARKVYDIAWRRQIRGEVVPNEEKLFSIYEQHTDIIVKGSREVQFGHKVNLSTGKSKLILSCEVLSGNPADSTLFGDTLDKAIADYGIIPRDVATDGGYASIANLEHATKAGISHIVFNKVVGSLRNRISSKNLETRLKKWRSGIEATISNLKRGFNLFRCNWKGMAHFKAKVMWGAIGYNIRVMAAAVWQLVSVLPAVAT